VKIAFIARGDAHKWGGDLLALHAIEKGIEESGHKTILTPSLLDATDADFVFLSHTGFDQRGAFDFLKNFDRRIGLIPFYEDFSRYYGPSYGLYVYVHSALLGVQSFDLSKLFEEPELIFKHIKPCPRENLINLKVLKNAEIIIANSRTEKELIQRDCPSAKTQVVHWGAGWGIETENMDQTILEMTGFKSGEYILQVGRFETRKNQLATIVASKDVDIPLLFIAASGYQPIYEQVCVEAIKKWRKAPTIIISQELPAYQSGHLKIIQMPKNELLSKEAIMGAFCHAGLHLHPAFCELPGYTYLESAKMGVATIASSWTSIKDYFIDPITGNYTLDERIAYVAPYDIPAIKEKIQNTFGKKYSQEESNPIFKRTKWEIAKDILALIH